MEQRNKRVRKIVNSFAAAVIAAALNQPALAAQDQEEWKKYQLEFLKLAESKMPAGTADVSDMNSWERRIRKLEAEGPSLLEATLSETAIRDRCITCHLGADNPSFAEAPEPFGAHPEKILQQHPAAKFGCAVCHGGDGAATTVAAAHATGNPSQDSLIPTGYLQSTCIGCHESSYELEGAEKLEAGRLAFEKYACYACHDARGIEEARKFSPPLQDLKKKIADTRWIMSLLRNPQKLSPKTIMPDFKLSDEEIRDMTAFLLTLETEKEYEKPDLSRASSEEGEKLYTELGCKACHSEKKDEESLRRRVPNLADSGVKLKTDWILEELKRPNELNPDARIPILDISETESAHIIAYLTTLKANADQLEAETLTTEGASPENGKEMVKRYGCYSCHGIQGFEEEKIPGMSVAETAKKAPADFPAGNPVDTRTKWDWIHETIESPRHYATDERPLNAPVYEFEEEEVENLTTFYLNNYRFELSDDYLVTATQSGKRRRGGERVLTDRNCRGCHMMEEDIQPRIEKHIQLKTYVPPRLVGEGEKVQPKWAKKYLEKPEPMRPWLKMRMPNFFFTEERIQVLIEYFSAVAPSAHDARLPYVMPIQKADIPQIEIDMAEYRVRFDKCMQCHPVSIEEGLPEDVKLEDLSINLILAKERLRFEWIKNFLKDPDKYAGAGTKMPYVYYSPEGVPKVSDADMWIDYIAKYLMVMEKVPEPLEEEEEEKEEAIDWTEMDY